MAEDTQHDTQHDYTQQVEEISAIAQERGFKVGAAESLTGGAITSALAAGAGAGGWVRRGGGG